MEHSSESTPDNRAWLAWLEKYAQATERTIEETQAALERVRKKRERERRRYSDNSDYASSIEGVN